MMRSIHRKMRGFTLIELLIFLIVTSLLASTILVALVTSTRQFSTARQNVVALQTAKKCMEWLIGQRALQGYNALTCPSTSTPSFCTAPTGYTISTNISCTTLNTDTNYKTVTITVSGSGDAALTTLLAAY